ncbi:MAG: transcription elongation factor GreA [Fimbriimonadales bacterium]|jgi:transcription elongation factor GreA|nr:transcription elongation factor GreA [Fimbriimonadales bacterium]
MAEADDTIWLTPSGMQRLKDELERLSKVERPEIAERIRENMDHGEYSEDNTELDEIKFEQALVEDRIAELQSVLAGAQVLDPKDIPTKKVGIGSVVSLTNTKNPKQSLTVTIVSSAEANPELNFVSDESPLGLAVIGKAKGDKVSVDAPLGKITYEIKKIGKVAK